MAKKRKKRRSSSSGKSNRMPNSLLDSGLQIGTILLGVAIGSQVKKFVEKKDAVSGTDLLGLDGETSKFTTPFLVCAAGSVATLLAKNNKHLRNIALGISVAGGAGLVNAFSDKPVVSLGNPDEYVPVMLPGIGSPADVPMLPGIGTITHYEQLPTQYDYDLDPALAVQPLQGAGTGIDLSTII